MQEILAQYRGFVIDVDNGYLYVGATDGAGGTGSQIRWLDYADGSSWHIKCRP